MKFPHVTVVDLRDPEQAERLRGGAVVEALSQASRSRREHPGSGVVRPFGVVIVDEADKASSNADIYAVLSSAALHLQIIVVMLARGGPEIRSAVLPGVFDSGAFGVLWVSNPAGIAWVPGTAIADGIGAWPADPAGEKALESLLDTLTIPEVFDEAFDTMQSHPSNVHTVGLKRWVFSLDTGQPIDDFIHEAGVRIAGDRGIDPSRDEPRFWTLPPELTGEAESDSVVTPVKGSVADLLGRAERRVGSLHRLAEKDDLEIVSHDREELIDAAAACGEAFDELVDRGIELLEHVDASDGIDQSEHAIAKKLGVNLHPGYEAPDLLDVSDDMLESVVWDLEQGHAIEPLLGRLRVDADAVRIPSQRERIEELERFKTSSAREHLETAGERFPASMWSAMLGVDWPALVDWRVGALVLAVGAVAVGVMSYVSRIVSPETGLEVGCAVDAVCDVSRSFFGWDGWSALSVVLLTLVALAVPVVAFGIWRMAREVRKWIAGLGIGRLVREARAIREHVAHVVLNDWVLGGYRRQAESMLSTARDTLASISRVVSDRMIDQGTETHFAIAKQQVNPQIEQNLNVQASAVLYRAFSPIVELIRLDVIALIARTVRAFWPRLQAKSGVQLPAQVAAAVDSQLEEYLAALDSETLLDASTGDPDADRRRRVVLEQLWLDQDIVAGAIAQAVGAGPATEMLQMVSLDDLSKLDTSSQSPTFIRFVPSLVRNRVDEVRNGQVDAPRVVLTGHLTSAGVLRLVPVRDGLVAFESEDRDVA